jgi:hypothetical protein
LIQGATNTVLATATGTDSIALTVPDDGLYYAQVAANTGSTAGIQAHYLLNVDIADATVPTVVGTTLSTAYNTAVDRFSATFSEDLLANAAVNPANYSLREAGPNGIFGDGDDSIYALTPSYGGLGSRMVGFVINPNPLQPGTYRFRTLAGLTDRAGNPVTAFTHDFTVAHPPAGRIENNIGNDSIPGATPLPMTETPDGSGVFTSLGVGTFFDGSDRDYWRFDAEAGDRVTLRLETGGGTNIYPFMYLQNAAGQNQATVSGNSAGSPIQIQNFAIPAPGTYYVYLGASNATSYQFRIDQARGPQLEVESNDSQAAANLLMLSGSGGIAEARVGGALTAGDTAGDYFRLNTLNTGNTINLSLHVPTFSSLATEDVRLSIQQHGGSTALATSTSGSLSYTAVEDAIYYVRLEGLANWGLRAQYLLGISVTDTIPPQVTGTTLPAEGSTSTAVIDRFSLNFSEDLANATVIDMNNYDLRAAGPDRVFDTNRRVVSAWRKQPGVRTMPQRCRGSWRGRWTKLMRLCWQKHHNVVPRD